MPDTTPPESDEQPSRLAQRRRMIEEQIHARHVDDEAVLSAMEAIPREHFLPQELWDQAYADSALGIGEGQTISQPYIVAYMTAQLSVTPDCRVLEIGTGTGYQTAILAQLAREVYSIERIRSLHVRAADALARLGATNVHLTCGDGTVGWEKNAPYDRIMVTAGAPSVSPLLTRQLVDGGILIAPIGGLSSQRIVRVERRESRTTETPLLPCRFVKLIGKEGWDPGGED